MHPVTARSRWIWAVSGLATAAALAVPGAHLISHPGVTYRRVTPPHTITRTMSVTQPITRLNVQSQSGSVLVHAGSGSTVRFTEYISYDKSAGPAPAVPDQVSGGRLTLADPACADGDGCNVAFVVTVPATVLATVTGNGATVAISGLAGANVDSGGGPVTLQHISGPATVGTDGGSLNLNGLTGALHADTGGGPLSARDVHGAATIATGGGSLDLNGLTGTLQADSGGGPVSALDLTAPAATVTAGGGSARLVFAAAPRSVSLFTDGGPAAVNVPGGPYALTTDGDGGPVAVRITSSPSARRTLTVSSGGGPLTIDPARPAR